MVMMRNIIETFTQVKGQESTAGRYYSDILPARCHVYPQFYNLEKIKGKSLISFLGPDSDCFVACGGSHYGGLFVCVVS